MTVFGMRFIIIIWDDTENVAEKFQITREDQDKFALNSRESFERSKK